MDAVLIVSSGERAANMLSDLLSSKHDFSISIAGDILTASRMFEEKEYCIVVINSPVGENNGAAFAEKLLNDTSCGVMLVVKAEFEQRYESLLGSKGAFIVSKPVNRTVFEKGISFIRASQIRMKRTQSENLLLHKKIDDNRIINRAKAILMEYLSMTEPQAHKYLERQAMDLRLTKLEVAKNLLSTYDS